MRRNPPRRNLGVFAAAAALLPAAMAASTPAPSDLPAVDFDRMGSVGLGGSFAGLDWFSAQSPFASGSNATAFSHNGDTVIMRNADGTVTVLGVTNDGGQIDALCRSDNTLYIGGSFTSVASTSSPNVVAYSIDQNQFVALDKGLSGPVKSLLCDSTNKEVWAGGVFNAPVGSGGNVARWSTQSSAWTAVPFGGLNGRVDTISPSTDGNSLYFGGDFTTMFADSRNTTAFLSLASIPIAPLNTQTTGNSGYLTPFTVPAAASQYGGLSVNAAPAASDSDHNNANLLLCPGSGTWFARDSSVAHVEVLANAYMSVAGVRISNGRTDGRAVKTFTLTTLPDNTVRKLTFGSGQNCNPQCSLSTDSNVWAQDFLFDDGLISITGLQLALEEWEGDGSALNYVELLSDGAYASYVQSDNQGVCGTSNTSVSAIGSWQNLTAPSNISGTEIGYMGATVPTDNTQPTALTLYPFVGSAGYYDIYLVIPGCANIGDCASRTTADISVFPISGGQPWTSTIDERVQYDTTILVYSGLVDASTATFNPTIHVALPDNPAPVDGGNYVIVASGVQMTLTGLSDGSESPYGSSSGINSATGGPGVSFSTAFTTSFSTFTGTDGTATSSAISTAISTAISRGPNGETTNTGGVGSTTSTSLGSSGSSTSTATSSSASASPSTTTTALRRAFGVYEWARSNTAQVNAATATLGNTTETDLTQVGFTLDVAKNASTAGGFTVNTIVPVGSTLFVGGNFALASSYQNVVSVAQGAASALSNSGLNGAVNSAVVIGDKLYLGGAFTGTSQGSNDLKYLAQYDPALKRWAAVGGGVDGPVAKVAAVSDGLYVAGNFTNVITANGTSISTGGYAIYNTTTNEWMSSGILYGTGSAVSDANNGTFVGGRFDGESKNPAPGIASLVMQDGTAAIKPLDGVDFSANGSAASGSTASRRSMSNDWFSHLRRALHIGRADVAPIPNGEPEIAPATLAGAYYTNASASGKPYVTILGGNFTSGSDISGVAFRTEGSRLTGPSPPVTGVVRALSVVGDTLYVGGDNLNVPGVGSGILQYNLANGSWIGAVPLFAASGDVLVNAIKQRENTDTIVAAGNFASTNGGGYDCAALCLWDKNVRQWLRPGMNAYITSGEVSSIDFGDSSHGTLVAGGSFVLSGKNVYAATYTFANRSWTPLGSLPGPVLSLAVNDKNLSSIFAHGIDSSTSQPYLQRWDGSAWAEQHSDSLATGTVIQQLAFVPLQRDRFHDGNSVMENNRMLMASGDIGLKSGNVSLALYDGKQWYPYLVGSNTKGAIGSVSSLFWSKTGFSFNPIKYLARGLVVLVAMAIATGLILILILLILLGAYCLRRHERKQQPAEHYEEKDTHHGMHTPASSTHQLIHESVQTALERSLMQPQHLTAAEAAATGAGAAGVGAVGAAYVRRSRHSAADDLNDADDEYGPGQYDDISDEGRETVMRYDFFGPELQAGELPMRAGQRVIVLDDEQSEEWWYCRDPETGREGVVPATYLL